MVQFLQSIFSIPVAQAHEAYVLSPQEFQTGLQHTGFDALKALQDPGDLHTFILITLCVALALVLNLIFMRSKAGAAWRKRWQKFAKFGPLIVRIAIALSFFLGALSNSFLGPEMPLSSVQYGNYFRIALFIISILIAAGVWTEIAAFAALLIFSFAAWSYGLYILTYLNYLGEIIVLLLFGSRSFSLDGLMFGKSRQFKKLQPYESTIVRICYGLALAYAAINIKFLHPVLTETVVSKYNLTQFHWLFPSDPLLVVLGAALAELAIGIFIALGFELRLTVLISMFYITMSLIYFRELVWPHLLLYGISISLLVQPEKFALDNLFFRKKKKRARRS